MIKDILKKVFKKKQYIFEDSKMELYILEENGTLIILGKTWISSIHIDTYSLLQKYCIENKIKTLDLSKCNITSRLISKLENLYVTLQEPIKLIVTKEQQVLLNYLTIKYPFTLTFVD
jgi:hypothetical protein